jgi:multiple sugar transport system ATP-binding protein
MRAELKRFHLELKATILYVTHDQLEAVTMADRIAVMNLGVLQQYAPPDEIFNRPVNTFVAGFIGSPAMNMLRGSVANDGGVVTLQGVDDWSLTLDEARGRQALQSSGQVIAGIRHGHIKLHFSPQPNTFPARIYTVEPTGDLTFVHFKVGDAVLVASASIDFRANPDDQVWVEFDQNELHLFDAETELALPRLVAEKPSHSVNTQRVVAMQA